MACCSHYCTKCGEAAEAYCQCPGGCCGGKQLASMRNRIKSLQAEVARLEAGGTTGKSRKERMSAIHYSS